MALSSALSLSMKPAITPSISSSLISMSVKKPPELIQLLVLEVDDVGTLEGQFGFKNLLLGLGCQVFACSHRNGSGQGAGNCCQEDLTGVQATSHDTSNEKEDGDQTVVESQDDVTPVLTGLSDVGYVLVGVLILDGHFGDGN